MSAYGIFTASADCRPSITSSLEKPKKNESLRSISVTRTASAIVSERRVASSSPAKPAPRTSTWCFTWRSLGAGGRVLRLEHGDPVPALLGDIDVAVGVLDHHQRI